MVDLTGFLLIAFGAGVANGCLKALDNDWARNRRELVLKILGHGVIVSLLVTAIYVYAVGMSNTFL